MNFFFYLGGALESIIHQHSIKYSPIYFFTKIAGYLFIHGKIPKTNIILGAHLFVLIII